jgi:hypothetical protein
MPEKVLMAIRDKERQGSSMELQTAKSLGAGEAEHGPRR